MWRRFDFRVLGHRFKLASDELRFGFEDYVFMKEISKNSMLGNRYSVIDSFFT